MSRPAATSTVVSQAGIPVPADRGGPGLGPLPGARAGGRGLAD